MYLSVLVVLSISAVFGGADGQMCIPVENEDYRGCACTISNTKQVINLAPLMNTSVVPRFTVLDPKTGWKFSYNPCRGFDMFVGQNNTILGYHFCKNAAIGRWTKKTTHQCFSMGPPSSAKFTFGEDQRPEPNSQPIIISNLTLTFVLKNDTLTKNEGVISLICNRALGVHNSQFKYLGIEYADYHSIYYFSLESNCCCPGNCGVPPSPAPRSSSTKITTDSTFQTTTVNATLQTTTSTANQTNTTTTTTKTTRTPAPSSDEFDKTIVIGLSVAAAVLLLIIIIVVLCLCCNCCRRRNYSSVSQ